MTQIVQCAPENAKILNTALRNTREIASQFSLSFFVLWTHIFSLLAHREFWYMPSTPRSSARQIFPRDGPFSVTVWLLWIFARLVGLKTLCSSVVSMKTSADRRPEAFLTNSHAYSTLPLNFSHFRFGLMVHPNTLFAEFHKKIELCNYHSGLPLEPFLQLFSF